MANIKFYCIDLDICNFPEGNENNERGKEMKRNRFWHGCHRCRHCLLSVFLHCCLSVWQNRYHFISLFMFTHQTWIASVTFQKKTVRLHKTHFCIDSTNKKYFLIEFLLMEMFILRAFNGEGFHIRITTIHFIHLTNLNKMLVCTQIYIKSENA